MSFPSVYLPSVYLPEQVRLRKNKSRFRFGNGFEVAVGPMNSNSFPYAGMIQVRFKGYDLRLDPATPERIRSKDSEFSRNCQAAAGYLHVICLFLRMYYFHAYDIQPRQPGAVHSVDRATPGAPRRLNRCGRRPNL